MTKPKSILIYAASKRLTPRHVRLAPNEKKPGYLEGEVWLRAVVLYGDALSVLERARPMRGETVMNSYEL